MAIIISAGFLITGCDEEDSPEKALTEIQVALKDRNSSALAERVNLEKFFEQTYDDTSIELVKDCTEYGKKYPEDPYFQHDAEFLQKYNSDYRDMHLKFLQDVQEAYFKRIPAPDKPEDDPYAYVADEFEKVRIASNAEIKNTEIDNDKAILTVEIKGDSSVRGQFIGTLDFELSFSKNENDKWRLNKIENLDELMPTLVDKAEKVWITFSN